MGQSSFVNPTHTRQAAARPAARPANRRAAGHGLDWILIGVIGGITLFGLLMVYSAGPQVAMFANFPADYYLIRQAIWVVVGIAAAVVMSFINYHRFPRFSVAMMVVIFVLLLAVIVLANTTFGANRSILSGSVRPSELAKVAIIIYVSVWLNAKKDVLNDITLGLFPLILILGLTAGFILIQPDLSAAFTIVFLGGVLFFLAGGEWRQIALTIVIACVLGWVVVHLSTTGMNRITEYMNGLQDPLNASSHVEHSLEAVINGRLFGVGIGHGSTKFTGLPVAHTDSIFAVIVEETGLFGAGMLILGYAVFLWRGLRIAQNAPDLLGTLIASGISIWVVTEAFVNMAVMVNLLPQAGTALPLISYGGSNLTTTLAAVGILLNIARVSSDQPKSKKGGGTFGAVVDLRWRDRGRSISRAGRASDTR